MLIKHGAAKRQNIIGLFLTFATFAILLPISLLSFNTGSVWDTGVFILWLQIATIVMFYTLTIYSEPFGIATSFFYIFMYVFFGVVPLLQYQSDFFPLPRLTSIDTFNVLFGYVVIFVGMIGIFWGSRFARSLAYKPHKYELRSKPILLLTLLSICIVTLVMLYRTGGVEGLLQNRYDRADIVLSKVGGVGAEASQVAEGLLRIPLLCISLFLVVIFHMSKIRWLMYLGAVTSFCCLFINNPLSTSRFLFGSCLISLAFVWALGLTKSRSIYVFIFGILGLIFVFPLMDVFRDNVDASLFDAIANFNVIDKLVGKMDFDAYQQFIHALGFVDRSGIQYGYQFLGLILFWVPRSIWLEKPLPTSILVSGGSGAGTDNLSMPLMAELYVDGSFILVLFGCALFGYFLRSLDIALYSLKDASKSGCISLVGMIGLFVAPYSLILNRGPLLGIIDLLTLFLIFQFTLFMLLLRRVS